MSTRAITPVVAVALLVLVTILAAATVGAGLLQASAPRRTPPRVSLSASADATADRITVVHRGGTVVSVARLRVRITIGGEPLAHQPPVPFFAATGFESGPTGPFNSAADGQWAAGERAAVELASTNSPHLSPGVTVRVDVYRGEYRIATATARAGR